MARADDVADQELLEPNVEGHCQRLEIVHRCDSVRHEKSFAARGVKLDRSARPRLEPCHAEQSETLRPPHAKVEHIQFSDPALGRFLY
jgi:hypothetical protein